MIYVKSDIDSEQYLVRDYVDKKKAANLLALIKKNIYLVTNHIWNKTITSPTSETPRYKNFKPYAEQLKQRIQNVIIIESAENSIYTSYCVNKGEQIVFCIRSKSISNAIRSNNIHDMNLVMYVALHEISHVACPEKDHTDLFKEIFHFICQEAISIGIYQRIDFPSDPREYCGMTINDSII